jgi:arylsulfatase A-like enzyme
MPMFPSCNLRSVVAVAALMLVAGCGPQSEPDDNGSNASGLNVIMICVHTVRWDSWWIPERAGFRDDFTPWVQRAQVLSHALSAAPWTVPSVGSILTGLYPSQHGGGLFDGPVANLAEEVPSALNPATPMLAESLAEAGYRTGAVSAHPWFDANYGFQRGFGQVHLMAGAEKLSGRGLEWLDAAPDDEQPFFLYMHYMDVHDPHLDLDGSRRTAEAMSADRRERLLATAPASACGDDPSSDMCVRYLTYADSTMRLRRHIASLLDRFDERGLMDDTLVVIYSDHGEEFEEHVAISRQRNEDPRGIYGFGHGQSLYQELLHVPLLLWHPELDGRELDRPVSLVDVWPTLSDWLGVPMPGGYEFPGRSFAEAVESAEAGPFAWREDPVQWHRASDRPLFASGIAYGPPQMAVIDGITKLIWREADNSREYYDLRDDPAERHPELDAGERVADRLEADLDRYFAWYDDQDYLPPELTDEVVEKLQGVGYLQGVDSGDDDAAGPDQTESAGDEPDS